MCPFSPNATLWPKTLGCAEIFAGCKSICGGFRQANRAEVWLKKHEFFHFGFYKIEKDIGTPLKSPILYKSNTLFVGNMKLFRQHEVNGSVKLFRQHELDPSVCLMLMHHSTAPQRWSGLWATMQLLLKLMTVRSWKTSWLELGLHMPWHCSQESSAKPLSKKKHHYITYMFAQNVWKGTQLCPMLSMVLSFVVKTWNGCSTCTAHGPVQFYRLPSLLCGPGRIILASTSMLELGVGQPAAWLQAAGAPLIGNRLDLKLNPQPKSKQYPYNHLYIHIYIRYIFIYMYVQVNK